MTIIFTLVSEWRNNMFLIYHLIKVEFIDLFLFQATSRGISPSPLPIINNATSPRKITEHNDDIGLQQQVGFKVLLSNCQ